MNKICILLALLLIVMFSASCAKDVSGPDSEVPPKLPELDSSAQTAENTSDGAEEGTTTEVAAYEWTEEEKGLLSIDTGKIDLFIGRDCGEEPFDALSGLKECFSDLELVSSDKLPSGSLDETWHSKKSGLSYRVYHWEDMSIGEDNSLVRSGIWHNIVQWITGHADDMITGLVAPIEVEELMKAPSMAGCDWAVGKGPESDRFGWLYDRKELEQTFYPSANDVCIVIPLTPFPSWNELAIGIRIKVSASGFISPEDEIEIADVTINP